MKPPIPVGYIKSVAEGRYGPATWANVFYFLIGGTIGSLKSACDACAEATRDFYEDGLGGWANFPSAWTLDRCRMVYRDATADFFRQTNVLTAVGTGGSGQDAQVALLVNWQVGDGRRGGKPRNYIPGVLDSVVADSARLDSTFVSTVSASINTWLTTIAGETPNFALVDMSFRDAKAWRKNAVPFPIHGGNLNEVVATQRRRVDRLRI